jgi:hypothetical protein
VDDAGKLIVCNSASNITITVPNSVFSAGANIDVVNINTGTVTIAGAGGVTVNATPGLKLRTQYSGASLVLYGTNTWLLLGDLAA